MRIICHMQMGTNKTRTEDRVLVGDSIIAGGSYDNVLGENNYPFVIAIADGVGGNAAGDMAAHMAVSSLAGVVLPKEINETVLLKILRDTNSKIIERSIADSEHKNMATTLSGVCFFNKRAFLFHVGNTRVYSWNAPYLSQLTVDHTWAEEMRMAGLTEEAIANSGRSTEIYSCLGNGDPASAKALHVHEITNKIIDSDVLILTSDGVHEYIGNEILESSLRNIDDWSQYSNQAVKYAKLKGSDDDLTIVIIVMK